MTSPKSAVKEKMKYSKTAGSTSIGSASSEKGKPISPYSILIILKSFPLSAGVFIETKMCIRDSSSIARQLDEAVEEYIG